MSTKVCLPRKWRQPLAPGAAREYEVDFDDALAIKWEPREWQQGDIIRAGAYDAQCLVAGRSGEVPPPWPETLDELVQDGSVTWKIIAPSASSQRTTISTFEWEPPEGIEKSGGSDGAKESSRLLTVGENVAPGEYTIVVTASCANGEKIIQPSILVVA